MASAHPALSIFAPETPPDVRRATTVLLSLAALCLLYSSLYGNIHLFRSALGAGLPYASTSASGLCNGLRALAVLLAAWGIGLALITAPGPAATLRRLWQQWTAAEARRRHVWAIAAVCSGAYAAAHVAWNSEASGGTLEAFTAGTAQTPFQYRALVPFLVHGLRLVIPEVPLWTVYGVIDALAALAAWAAFRRFLRPLVGTSAERSVAGLAVFVVLALNLASPFRHNPYFFPYDTLAVALFTAGLALMQERRWWLFYPLFVAATLNRETTCFLTIAFVLSGLGRVPLRTLALHGAAQTALWVGVKGLLRVVYQTNAPLWEHAPAGGFFITPYLLNLGAVSSVPGLLMLVGAMGGLWVVLCLLRSRLPASNLRRLFRIVPVWMVGMFLVGEMLEVRIYSELIPLVVAGLIVAVRSVVREASQSEHPGARVENRNGGGDGYPSGSAAELRVHGIGRREIAESLPLESVFE